MKVLTILAATFLMTATGALAAAPGADGDAKAEADEAAKKEKKICRSEKMTGSLTRVRRVCMTRAEWAELAENTNRALDRMGRSANHAEAMTDRTARGAGAAGAGGF